MRKNIGKNINDPIMENDLNHFLALMGQRGLNTTKQRVNIAKIFFCMQGHHSLEEIYQEVRKKYPSIGQTTVYRTIKLMCEVGLAEELHVGDNFARYEVCIGKQHHDHLVCTACGKTIEFHLPEIEKYQKELAEKNGFTLLEHRHILLGICEKCRAEPPEKTFHPTNEF